MIALSTVDYISVAIYLVAIAAFGSSFYRRKSTAREYFLGGRSMGWLPAGISIVAADLSAITVMGAPAWAYKHNLELWLVAFGYPLVAPIVIFVFVPFYSRLNLYTAYEYLERRFSLSVRLVVSALFQMLRAWHVAVAIYGPALVINLVTGLPVWECVLAMGLFTTFYTSLGGVKAVIWTDVIQFVTVTTGVVLILTIALAHVPGGLPAAFSTVRAAGRLQIINLSTDPTQLTSLWACLFGGAVLALGPLATDQAILQRLFTTKSTKDCRQSVVLQAFLIVPVILLLNVVGLALFAFYQAHPGTLQGLTNLDSVVPYFAVTELPRGVAGLVIAAIFAASMAVMSAGINALTTATTVDFYQRLWRPDQPAEHYARVGRFGTAAWGCVVTSLGLLANRAGDLVVAYSRVSSVLVGPMLGVFLLGATTRRANPMGALAGAFAGVAAVSLVIVTTRWSFFYFGVIGTVFTFGIGYAVSLLFPKPRPEQIHGLVMGQGEVRNENTSTPQTSA
jgi:solute:Na+ symporter, SSS family